MNIKLCVNAFQNELPNQDMQNVRNILAEYVKDICKVLINNENADLLKLSSITFTDNFSEEVRLFDENVSLSNKAVGKVIDKPSDDGIEHHIFFDRCIPKLIFLGKDNQTKMIGFNALWHELVHVYDNSNILKMLNTTEFEFEQVGHTVVYNVALSSWKEYLAHRIAMKYSPKEIDYSTIRDELLTIENKLEKFDYDYENELESIDDIYNTFYDYITTLVRVISEIHESDEDKGTLLNLLEGLHINNFYEEISNCYLKLFNDYPKWKDYNVFDNLVNIYGEILDRFLLFNYLFDED